MVRIVEKQCPFFKTINITTFVGRAFDNIMVERLWRTVKYEDIYIRDYQNPAEARFGLTRYFDYYNHRRRHSSLGRQTPARIYGLAKPRNNNKIKRDGGVPPSNWLWPRSPSGLPHPEPANRWRQESSTLTRSFFCPNSGDNPNYQLIL